MAGVKRKRDQGQQTISDFFQATSSTPDEPAANFTKTENPCDFVAWLNSIPHMSRVRLYQVMYQLAQESSLVKRISHIHGDLDWQLLQGYVGGSRSGGAGWVKFATCERIDGWRCGNAGSHARWQPRVISKGRQPAVSTVGGRIKAALSSEDWEKLCSVVPQGATGQLKLGVHLIAYGASEKSTVTPIPLDRGKGSSLSHHCDQQRCISSQHISVASHHVDNLARQRCPGVVLICFNGNIVEERPCVHACGASLEERLGDSCRKVCTILLGKAAAAAVAALL